MYGDHKLPVIQVRERGVDAADRPEDDLGDVPLDERHEILGKLVVEGHLDRGWHPAPAYAARARFPRS